MLNKLKKSGNIHCIQSEKAKQLIGEQKDALTFLKNKQCKEKWLFLNAYDRLFRHVTIWLLQKNYNLTSITPHQTLLSICSQFADKDDIKNMIKTRHQLKKTLADNVPIPKEDIVLLDYLLSHFNDNYQ